MKNCLIVVNTHKKESHATGQLIAEYLSEKNIQSSFYCFDGFCSENPFEGYDFVVTLGGDGTVLFAARGCVSLGVPIFPINFGEFGFIASVQQNEWKNLLDDFLNGLIPVEQRSMLNADVYSSKQNEPLFSSLGLNDVVICAKTAARTICLNVAYNGTSLGDFKADGIIVSTSTGSTAYSASAGGPIIDPKLDALVLTPINSFSLSSRPLVLSPLGEIEITILPSREKDVIITVDGQKPFDLTEGYRVKIKQIDEKVKLVGCNTEKFYDALRSKLNWSGGPHA